MMDSLREAVSQQPRLPVVTAVLMTLGLLALQYYLFRTGRRTKGLAKSIEAEIEPWMRQIREKHFGKGKANSTDKA